MKVNDNKTEIIISDFHIDIYTINSNYWYRCYDKEIYKRIIVLLLTSTKFNLGIRLGVLQKRQTIS